MKIFILLALMALVPIALTVLLYNAEKKGRFSRLSNLQRQLLIGCIFGGAAVLSTTFGVDTGGAIANVRDAAVLCAGLLFGPVAGLTAGLIGGIERWFTVLWGVGEYTRAACTISTIAAGFGSAFFRYRIFEDRKPTFMHAFNIGLITEVFHMMMIFVTNMNDVRTAFSYVQLCALPMITVNALTVMTAALLVQIMSKEKTIHVKDRQIITVFQQWLFLCVVFAFAVMAVFTYVLQSRIAVSDTASLLSTGISDVETDISDRSDTNLLSITRRIGGVIDRQREENPEEITQEYLTQLAQENSIAEINIIDSSGIISVSTDAEYVGFNMASGDQSSAFMVLLHGTEEYVQEYQPISYDSSVSRKFAGVTLDSGGFVQVGYDAENFQADLASEVVGLTRSRHIGNTGYTVIADQNQTIVSDRMGNEGKKLKDIGMPEDLSSDEEGQTAKAEINGDKVYWMYGTNEGYYIVSVYPVTEADFSRNMVTYMTIFLAIIIFVVLFLEIYNLIKRLVVDNIHKVNQSLNEITDGNLNVVVDVRNNDEFASLSDDINQTVVTLKSFIKEAAERIDKELVFAREIQYSSLPSIFPPYPDRVDQFDIYAGMKTAKEVGGDFYDFYLIDENHLAFLIADVSGKGIPAAMFMMRAKTIIADYAKRKVPVDEVFTSANRELCEHNDAEMFVTGWLGEIDLTTGDVQFANAGHNPPLVRHADGGYEYLKSKPGFVLAGMEGIAYRSSSFHMDPGDVILLYTDGVTEAENKAEELYGEERLQKTVNQCARNASCRNIIDSVRKDVNAFVDGADQFDDITMLALIYKGGETMKITCDATVQNIEKVTDFVNSELEKLNCPMKAQTQIDIAIDELFGNIAHYAYDPDVGPATVSVEVAENPLSVIITFTDHGKPFNPLEQKDPDITSSAEERDIGGLGIFMVKKSMDSIHYEYKDGQNILTIQKNISEKK